MSFSCTYMLQFHIKNRFNKQVILSSQTEYQCINCNSFNIENHFHRAIWHFPVITVIKFYIPSVPLMFFLRKSICIVFGSI